MNDPSSGRTDRIRSAILDYLARHPNARDSARGIRDCWLPEALQGSSQEDVELALQTLVEDGRVGAVTVLHNPTLFARATCAPSPAEQTGPGEQPAPREQPGKPRP